jgi:hypothetical protein
MDFDINRLRRADQVIGGGAIALFIFVFFFKWLGFSSNTPLGGINASSNGWHSFSNSRWIWLITIIVALGVVFVTATQRQIQSPVGLGAIVAGLGALSTVLILYRIFKHPSGGQSGTVAGVHYGYSYGIKIGIWLGLIAAAAITYGGYLKMQAEGTSIADVRGQAGEALSNLTSSSGSGSSGAGAGSAPAAPAPPAASPAPPPAAAAPGEAPPPLPPPAAPEQGGFPPPQQ